VSPLLDAGVISVSVECKKSSVVAGSLSKCDLQAILAVAFLPSDAANLAVAEDSRLAGLDGKPSEQGLQSGKSDEDVGVVPAFALAIRSIVRLSLAGSHFLGSNAAAKSIEKMKECEKPSEPSVSGWNK